mmetsp:Transcript_69019/g.152707  ORF Transcript_69019/g.152707 Transcript_69019/m.152707 type:complete len:232 (+) Transcript_69019:249-944(+)
MSPAPEFLFAPPEQILDPELGALGACLQACLLLSGPDALLLCSSLSPKDGVRLGLRQLSLDLRLSPLLLHRRPQKSPGCAHLCLGLGTAHGHCCRSRHCLAAVNCEVALPGARHKQEEQCEEHRAPCAQEPPPPPQMPLCPRVLALTRSIVFCSPIRRTGPAIDLLRGGVPPSMSDELSVDSAPRSESLRRLRCDFGLRLVRWSGGLFKATPRAASAVQTIPAASGRIDHV